MPPVPPVVVPVVEPPEVVPVVVPGVRLKPGVPSFPPVFTLPVKASVGAFLTLTGASQEAAIIKDSINSFFISIP